MTAQTSVPTGDIAYAKTYLPNFGVHYRGPNILNTGFQIEDPTERQVALDDAWLHWASFARSYFMVMLNTLGGYSTLALQSEIVHTCTPEEALGARSASDLFWRRDLARRGKAIRAGGWLFTHVQHAILADEEVNRDVFTTVERTMETAITQTLRTRRNFLAQIDDTDVDHGAGLQDDLHEFFGAGRPQRLSRKQRNANYDHLLF